MPSPQQIKEIQSALAVGRAEPGEVIIADLGTDVIACFVPRASIIHCDLVRRLQAGSQHVSRFGEKLVLAAVQ